MHLIDYQYLKRITTNQKDADMHDLYSIYTKVFKTVKSVAKEYFVYGENHKFYPNPPRMSDLAIISLVITAESLQITSENLLWYKIEKDYPQMFPQLIHRASFNRRRKALRELLLSCTERLAEPMIDPNESFIIDSIPLPTCKIIREKRSKACRREEFDEVVANKGFSQILGGYFIGYKMHIITTESGVYRDLLMTSGSTHDTAFLKQLDGQDDHLRGREILADRGYIGKDTQLRLFREIGVQLQVPYRRNQKDFKKYDVLKKRKRKTIEVVFSQFCDEFTIRSNYAKRFNGFEIRIVSKIAAKTFKQYWNYLHGRPINRTKHSLAA